MKYCNLYCHNNKGKQCIQNISHSSTNGAAHIRVINTNEADSRCAAPHGKISLPHLSVRQYILSVWCCADAAGGPEDTRSSSSSALNTLHSFGLWLVTTVIASHGCCHVFPSDSLSAILSLRLNWSSKLHPGTRREAWSIGRTWERLSLFPCCLLDTGRLTQNRQIPFASSERFFFLVASLSWSVLSRVPVPVSTFSSLLCFPSSARF